MVNGSVWRFFHFVRLMVGGVLHSKIFIQSLNYLKMFGVAVTLGGYENRGIVKYFNH